MVEIHILCSFNTCVLEVKTAASNREFSCTEQQEINSLTTAEKTTHFFIERQLTVSLRSVQTVHPTHTVRVYILQISHLQCIQKTNRVHKIK
jgi:hypothetical protein